jgi:hypothetical protein
MATPASQTLSGLRAGFARVDITPEGSFELAGNFSWRPRLSGAVRDRLQARVLWLEGNGRRLGLAVLDTLLVSEELHRRTCRKAGLERAELLLSATHTHSSFGGLFPPPASSVLGSPQPQRMEWLSDRLAAAFNEARQDAAGTLLRYGQSRVAGFTSCRRQHLGPYDDEFRLLLFERPGRSSLVLVNASGHPVVVAEKDPHLVSADWPGELCRRLEKKSLQAVFLPAALGGTSALFPEFPMSIDRHLELLGDLAERGVLEALQKTMALDVSPLERELLFLQHPEPRCEIFSALGRRGKFYDALLWPLRRWVSGRLRKILAPEKGVPLHLVRLGRAVIMASAHEMGANLVGELLLLGRRFGFPLVVSLADGYAGYLHLAPQYRLVPEKGFRWLAYYENALAVFGREMGERIAQEAASWLEQSFNPPPAPAS